MTESPESTARIIELEYQLAHLQRLFEQLNEVVTEQAHGLDRTRRRVAELENQIKELKQKPSTNEPLDPTAEKPPHY